MVVGMTSIDFTPEILSGQQPVDLGTEAKAGNVIFIAIVILLGATIFYFLTLSGRHYDGAQTFTLKCLLFNVLPMMVRSIFLCYRVFGLHNYFKVNVWAQLGEFSSPHGAFERRFIQSTWSTSKTFHSFVTYLYTSYFYAFSSTALQYVPELIIVAVSTALGFILTFKYDSLSSSQSQSELDQLQHTQFTEVVPSYHQAHQAPSYSPGSEQEKYFSRA